ncbi:MAG: family 20 glycosylhydrolase [Clostridiales bacterium]|nr:family 20 glycosylhydrolase [Clostridiales bacterium]
MMQDFYPYTAFETTFSCFSRETALFGPNSVLKLLHTELFAKQENNLNQSAATVLKRICFCQRFEEKELAICKKKLGTQIRAPRQDAFCILIEENEIVAYSNTLCGLIYAAWALVDWCQDGIWRHGLIYCTPKCDFRGLKIFLPAPEELVYFHEVVDTALSLRCNTVILEVGGAMEYKHHPEINEGWVEYARFMNESSGKTIQIQEQYSWAKNSIHTQNGGGGYLSQDTVRELVKYCRERGMEVIPEVPSLSHSDYLLTRHPELAERKEDPFPDTYCPSNPDSYALLFDVLEEVIDVFDPKVVHIAHDELNSIAICEKCKTLDSAQIFAEDIKTIHGFLHKKGISTMMWSDKLLNAHCASGYAFGGAAAVKDTFDWHYESVPATWQAIDLIPRDIQVMHWIWTVDRRLDEDLLSRGFATVFGNLNGPAVPEFERRLRAGINGGCVSNWSALHPDYICRNGIFFNLAFCAVVFWGDYREEDYAQRAVEILTYCFERQQRNVLNDSYFDILHTTDFVRPFQFYFDGHMVDRSKDSIGYYQITMSGGNTVQVPVIFGENIAASTNHFSQKPNGEFDQLEYCTSLLEISGNAVPVWQSNEMVYRCVYPNPYPEQQIVSAKFVPASSFFNQVKLYSIAAVSR